MSAPRVGAPIVSEPVDTRARPGRKPTGKPSQSKRATRPKRTCETIGGPGRKMAKGERLEGNLPGCALTPEIFDTIVGYVEEGNFRIMAVKAAGVNVETFKSWISTGRKQVKQYLAGERTELPLQAQLVEALDHAEGVCHVRHHARIIDPTLDVQDRKLLFTVLQKRFARDWATPKVQNDDETGEQVHVDAATLLAQRLAKIFGHPEESDDDDDEAES